MPDGHQLTVLRALREVFDLPDQARQAIVALDLPVYDSLVLAYLYRAGTMLAADAEHDPLSRNEAWSDWSLAACHVLDFALRYHANEPLVVTIAALKPLFLSAYPHASLRGFKALDDLLQSARHDMMTRKRGRAIRRMRLRDTIGTLEVWVNESGQMRTGVQGPERDRLAADGFVDRWGVQLTHARAEKVLGLLRAVMPLYAQRTEAGMLLVPANR